MAIDFTSTSSVSIAGSSKMYDDALINILIPGQYAFNVKGAPATTPPGFVIPAGAASFNIASCYNATNGRFTAPVAGIYFVRWNQLAPNATTGEFRTAIYVNGAAYGGLRYITYKASAAWWTLIAEGYVKLAVNDYANVRYESSPGSVALYTDANYGSFSGHYIG